MLDPGITADLLEEKLMRIEHKIPDDTQLHNAIREAIRHLRGEDDDIMLSADAVRSFSVAFSLGAEIACYLERRGYYKPEAVIVQNMSGTVIIIHNGVGRETFSVADYNRTWRLYAKYPDAQERQKHQWEA